MANVEGNQMDPRRKEVAMKRWRLLGKMLLKGRCNIEGSDASISVRRFASFGLLKTKVIPHEGEGARHLWYKYSSPYFPKYAAEIRHLDGTINIQDLLGFNNTGNVCLWPSEEILTHYALAQPQIFEQKTIVELGGGMTCLAGIAIATTSNAKEVLLTDGNDNSVKNVDVVLERNREAFGDTQVTARTLLWNEYNDLGSLEGKFDMVVMADCLFFDDYREDLLNVLDRLLKPKGEVLSFHPSRSGTFKIFAEMASEKFKIETAEKYDEMIWNLHLANSEKGEEEYDPNIHYPMLMRMWKKE